MKLNLIVEVLFSFIGGLGIFLLGMKNMSDGLQAITGDKLRNLIGRVTGNRFSGIGVGLLVTCIVQSSSITTVMVIGFVNSGLMELTQAISVILGANIGTTITGWILVLKIGKYGLPIMGTASFFFLFSKKDKWKYLALSIMGVGMIFFGLELMKNGFKPIRSLPEFSAWLSVFDSSSYLGIWKCVLTGCILTLIVQSSSATLGITMGLASTGIIGFESASALVLGENIGTTITAYLASIGTNTNAKRASYAHIVFNIFGVIWITLLFHPYLFLVKSFLGVNPNHIVLFNNSETYPYIVSGIATVHTGFNVVNTLLFVPLITCLANLLEHFVPDKDHKEPLHLTKLDTRMLETPLLAIEQARIEILGMGDTVEKMMGYLKILRTQKTWDDDIIKKIFHREEILDLLQKEIVEFLSSFLSGALPLKIADEGRLQLRMADEYESVSDYIVNILKLHLRLSNANTKLPKYESMEIDELHENITSYMKMINFACKNQYLDIISKAHTQADIIRHQLKNSRKIHLDRFSEVTGDTDSQKIDPLVNMIFGDFLHSYRRVKDHMLNIAEAMAGEK